MISFSIGFWLNFILQNPLLIIGFYIQKYRKNTNTKNGIIKHLFLLYSELWRFYWCRNITTRILSSEIVDHNIPFNRFFSFFFIFKIILHPGSYAIYPYYIKSHFILILTIRNLKVFCNIGILYYNYRRFKGVLYFGKSWLTF